MPDGGRFEPAGSSAEAPAGDWPAFVNGFIEASFKANPGFAVAQGRHEYDGQIADLSQAAIDGEVARLKKAIADAEAFGDDKLTDEQSTSATIWSRSPRANCSGSTRPAPTSSHNNPAAYLGMLDPSVYITVPYAPKEQRLKAYIKFLAEHPARRRADARQHQDADGDAASSTMPRSAFGGFVEYYPGDGMAAWKGVGIAPRTRRR